MEFLTEKYGFEILFYILTLSLMVLFFLIVVLLFHRSFQNSIWQHFRHDFKKTEQEILHYMGRNDGYISAQINLKKSIRVRDLIVQVAEHAGTKEKNCLAEIYFAQGYFFDDVKSLASQNKEVASSALARCRVFLFRLPDDVWTYLINHNSLVFRWAAMEYLVTLEKGNSLIWIEKFISNKNNRLNGIVLHLMSILALKDAKVFLSMIYSEDEWIVEQVMRVLASYPNHDADEYILNFIVKLNNEELFISCIKALAAKPSEKVIKYFQSQILHPHWVVRLQIAKAIKNFEVNSPLEIIATLLNDENYFVREAVIKSIIYKRCTYDSEINAISSDLSHPCHLLLVSEMNHLEVA